MNMGSITVYFVLVILVTCHANHPKEQPAGEWAFFFLLKKIEDFTFEPRHVISNKVAF